MGNVLAFHTLDKDIKFSAKKIELRLKIAVVFERCGFEKPLEVIESPNLTSFFVHFELGQFLKCHPMDGNCRLSRQLPNLKITVAHLVSRIPDPGSR